MNEKDSSESMDQKERAPFRVRLPRFVAPRRIGLGTVLKRMTFGRVDGGGNIFDIRNTDRSVYIRSASGRRHAEVRRCVSTDLSFQPYVP